MASHGVPRATSIRDRTEEARQKELEEIKEYQGLVEAVNKEVAAEHFTPILLRQTAELLKKNPEYYTIWNHRRRIYASEFKSLNTSVQSGELPPADRDSQILDIIKLDLQFLFPLLLKYPKCYWIWNHRLWLLQSATDLLPAKTARRLWEEELGLVGKMLGRDSRNYHGWGYRRMVIGSLESPELDVSSRTESTFHEEEKKEPKVGKGTSMAKSEFDYTTKMIGTNLSNFSAWHNRTRLILRMLEEQNATDEERKETLDEELTLIHRALFDPYDASLWSYHQSLLCTFNCKPHSSQPPTLAPNLSNLERLDYLAKERAFVEEMTEDETLGDCKWIWQRLVDIVLLMGRVRGVGGSDLVLEPNDKEDLREWIRKLKELDPLRMGRWKDLERNLEMMS